MDVKQGKKRQTGTHENELVHMSASSFNNADDTGDFYHEVACVPWPRVSAAGRRDLTPAKEAAGMVAAPCQQGKPTDHELQPCLIIQH